MIPTFPAFKVVDVSDRDAVEAYTRLHPPYSDFDFTSLWSWDTNSQRMISDLNGNLVVRFTDYGTGGPFFSFLGTNEVEQTTRTLIEYAKENNMSPVLRLIPEETAKLMQAPLFVVEEDRDNFDYIYSVAELAVLCGQKFNVRRHMAQRFSREHPEARFELVDPSDAIIEEYAMSIMHEWEADKQFKDHNRYELENEKLAIKRVFDAVTSLKLVVSGIFVNDVMSAFSIDEIVPDRYCMGHFWKADMKYKGIYDFHAQQIALYLQANQMTYWNWEQDLGVKGLRKTKLSYRPSHFLKKYKISMPYRYKTLRTRDGLYPTGKMAQ
ncbi:DUF2156 domain-containing protein [Candidatus Kaiserbacteria bacterium]|nr:DUF2156 domain-containing protein [Candidatus Kaiserbacteria bacterium]